MKERKGAPLLFDHHCFLLSCFWFAASHAHTHTRTVHHIECPCYTPTLFPSPIHSLTPLKDLVQLLQGGNLHHHLRVRGRQVAWREEDRAEGRVEDMLQEILVLLGHGPRLPFLLLLLSSSFLLLLFLLVVRREIAVEEAEFSRYAFKARLFLLPIHLGGQAEEEEGDGRRRGSVVGEQVGEGDEGRFLFARRRRRLSSSSSSSSFLSFSSSSSFSFLAARVKADAEIFIEHGGLGEKDLGGSFRQLLWVGMGGWVGWVEKKKVV